MTQLLEKVRFDGWTLCKTKGDLSKGIVTTRLQAQPLQILLELVEHPGELVTREQLIARLWPKGIVEFDASLNTAVRKLRVALNDDPDQPRYIETIPRRGYRFLATVEPVVEEPEKEPPPPLATVPPPRRRRTWWYVVAGLVLAGALAAGTWFRTQSSAAASLLVLPFADMSAEKKDGPLCFGITEELSSRLAQLPDVRVVARTSAFQYLDKGADVREIGKTLGATHILEGSVRRDHGVLRVTVQLINAADGYHLYAESFDFPGDNVLDVEQTLAQSVAQELRIWLSSDLLKSWERRNARSIEAFDYYLRARRYGGEYTADGDDQAAQLYKMAIDRDPDFSLAYVGLAEIRLSGISEREIPVSQVADEVAQLLGKAEKLNSNMPELFAVKGWFAMEKSDYPEAIKLLNAALALNPSDSVSHARLGNVYELLGKPREALDQFTHAAELDPLDYIPQLYRCIQLQTLGQFEEGERACARARSLKKDSHWGPFVTSWLQIARGNLPEAIDWTVEANKLAPSEAAVTFTRIDILLMLGLVDEARDSAATLVTVDQARVLLVQANLALAERGKAGLQEFLAREDTIALDDSSVGIEAVRLYHTAGNLDRARQLLRKIYDAPGFDERTLYNVEQARVGFSAALVCAALMLETGEREHAMKLLKGLDELLDRLEANGWAGHALDSMRAESLSLQGQPDAAMRSLRRAVARGWRGAWRAQYEPYLAALRGRPDYIALINDVEARNASMRARFLKVGTTRQ